MNKTRIAIVEDDSDDREFISMALEQTSDLEISLFPNGTDFLEFMKDCQLCPDLIITDLRMPLISGFDVIQTLKDNSKTKDIPIVVLSTSSNSDDMSKAKKLGAAAFYVKPYNLTEYSKITDTVVKNFRGNLLRFSALIEEFLMPAGFRVPRWIN